MDNTIKQKKALAKQLDPIPILFTILLQAVSIHDKEYFYLRSKPFDFSNHMRHIPQLEETHCHFPDIMKSHDNFLILFYPSL